MFRLSSTSTTSFSTRLRNNFHSSENVESGAVMLPIFFVVICSIDGSGIGRNRE